MLRTAALLFGVIFLLIGVLGFVPQVAPNDYLLGYFHINFAHNSIHILSGVIALICGLASEYASKLYFRIFGVIYAAVAVLGFFSGDKDLLGVVANNSADNYLHVAIAVVSLYLGFSCCCCKTSCSK